MVNISEELKQKLLVAKSVEEVFELSKTEYAEVTYKEAEDLYARILSKNKELGDEELNAVVGGQRQEESQGKYHFFNPVGKYDGVVGEEYYLVEDFYFFYPDWYHGRMEKTYEKSMGLGTTERTHLITVDIENGKQRSYVSSEEFSGDRWNLYKSMDHLWED